MRENDVAASIPVALDEASELWHRPSVNDLKIIREVANAYRNLPFEEGDVFLDLGAHIGAACRLAFLRGAAKAIAVEPDPANIELLRRNTTGMNVQIIEAAVGDRSGSTMLYTRASKPHLSTTVSNEAGREAIEVPMISLGSLMKYRPTVVKADIEFDEYNLTKLNNLPSCVRVLAIEIHIRYDLVFDHARQSAGELTAKRRAALDMVASIEAQGFRRLAYHVKEYPAQRATDDTGLPPDTASIEGIWERA